MPWHSLMHMHGIHKVCLLSTKVSTGMLVTKACHPCWPTNKGQHYAITNVLTNLSHCNPQKRNVWTYIATCLALVNNPKSFYSENGRLEGLRDWRENGGEERREIGWMKWRGEFCCPSAVYCVAHAGFVPNLFIYT